MASWISPIGLRLRATFDSESFKTMGAHETGLPLPKHPGAFGAVRKRHIHEGVDLYCPTGTKVFPVEAGIVKAIVPFTGPQDNSDWWNDTDAVFVEGQTGVVVYGEIAPDAHLKIGQQVETRTLLGTVVQVLKEDKGRPMSMLHLELHEKGTMDALPWPLEGPKPSTLLDPTVYLLDCQPRMP